jgi:predicted enzyme related to lactoylglutathione lyase
MRSRRSFLITAAAVPAAAQSKKAAPHPVIHFEIGCTDTARTSKFFADLFDWKIEPAPGGGAAAIDTGGKDALAGHISNLGHEPTHYTIFYIQTDNVQASLDKAVALGGKAIVGPITIPSGAFAWFADPDGNILGLLQPPK